MMPGASPMTTPVAVDDLIVGRHAGPGQHTVLAPPGHLPLITAGTSVVEFSPTADLPAVQTVIGANVTGGAA
jgi:hypothetical protein